MTPSNKQPSVKEILEKIIAHSKKCRPDETGHGIVISLANMAIRELDAGQAKGMRWVKASERLPENKNEIVFVKCKGKSTGKIIKSALSSIFFEDCDVVEWLDEFPNQESYKEENDDEKCFALLEEYDMSERLHKTIHHALTKVPEDNKENFIVNLCNGMVGSAILHYRNKYEKKLDIKPFNQQI